MHPAALEAWKESLLLKALLPSFRSAGLCSQSDEAHSGDLSAALGFASFPLLRFPGFW
jgi:hypothetical protein